MIEYKFVLQDFLLFLQRKQKRKTQTHECYIHGCSESLVMETGKRLIFIDSIHSLRNVTFIVCFHFDTHQIIRTRHIFPGENNKISNCFDNFLQFVGFVLDVVSSCFLAEAKKKNHIEELQMFHFLYRFSHGMITNYDGNQKNTVAWKCFMSHRITFGDPTLFFTTSEYIAMARNSWKRKTNILFCFVSFIFRSFSLEISYISFYFHCYLHHFWLFINMRHSWFYVRMNLDAFKAMINREIQEVAYTHIRYKSMWANFSACKLFARM